MPPVRILLAETPAALRSLVENALAGTTDLVIVADTGDEVATLLQAASADVVVISMAGGEMPALAERLLDEYPRLGVLAVDLEKGQGLLYRLRPKHSRVEATPGAIVAALRDAAAEIAV